MAGPHGADPLTPPHHTPSPQPYRRTLTGGLTLTCFFDARLSKWNLWLSRIRTHPSIVELNLVRRAFEVPTGHQVAQAHNEDDDSYSTYLTWVEYAQAHKIKVIA